jgi:arsenate reductase
LKAFILLLSNKFELNENISLMKKRKIWYLANCTTCQAIIQNAGICKSEFEFQDIKTSPITPLQLDELKNYAGSFEALFSKKALKYREWNLSGNILEEKDYRNYILQEYTFLKRPVVLVDSAIFVGSTPKNIAALKEAVAAIKNNNEKE